MPETASGSSVQHAKPVSDRPRRFRRHSHAHSPLARRRPPRYMARAGTLSRRSAQIVKRLLLADVSIDVAWLVLAVGDDRQHGGNDGYDDNPAVH